MWGYLERVLNVKPDDLHDFKAMVHKEYSSASTTPAPVAVPAVRECSKMRKQPAVDFSTNPYISPASTSPLPSPSNSTSLMSLTCQTPPSANPVKARPRTLYPPSKQHCLHTPHQVCGSSVSSIRSASCAFTAASVNGAGLPSCAPPVTLVFSIGLSFFHGHLRFYCGSCLDI
jgi:hypothetical protein